MPASLNASKLAQEQFDLHNKSSEVLIKTRSPGILAAIQRPGH